jgi:membrane protein
VTLPASVRRTAHEVLEGFARHRLLTYASAIAYQVLSALIPFALFALALAGLLDLQSLWTNHLEPSVARNASPEVFRLVSKTVNAVLRHKQTFWLTFGLIVVLWELGGAVRATMEALDDIFRVRKKRTRTDKYVTSTWLSAAVGMIWLASLACVAGGWLGGPFGALARYVMAGLLLTGATGLTLRIAPATKQPVAWVSAGSVVIVLGWLLVVGGYVVYATSIASYSSVFGALAAAFVLLVATYLSAVVFLTGVLIDDVARRRG